jgi:hypothetical protein
MTARPTIDKWRESLLVELRLRDIPGPRIGEIMAEVDTHCADSGESPQDAFGDPATYARSFDGPPAGNPRRIVGTAARAALGVAGILATLEGATATIEGQPAAVRAGYLASLAIGVVVFVTFLLLRTSRRTFLAVLVALWIGAILPIALWRTPVVELKGWALGAAGVGMLLVGFWPELTGRVRADLVIDPRDGTVPNAPPRWAMPLVRWGPIVMIIVTIAALTLLTTLT